MLKLRVVTGVVLAGVALWAIYGWPPFWFAVFLLVAAFCCAWEWSTLLNIEQAGWRYGYAITITAVTALILYLDNTSLMQAMVLLAVICWIAKLIDLIMLPVNAKVASVRWCLLVLVNLVLVTSVSALFWIRENQSAHAIVYIVALVAAADIGAYFSGRAFGKRKLAVQISAGKTIEGAIGGLVLAGFVAIVGVTLVPLADSSIVGLLIFSVVAAVYSIAGDLYISRAKRTRGVKDSGNLLPGHGGVLDRFDGLLAAVPWVAFAMLWT